MHDKVVEQVERYLTQVMSVPSQMFSVSHLASLDLPNFHVALASPKNMSRGGDLPFVISGDRVMPGNHEALEEIVRTRGLGESGGLSIDRFVELFFLLVVVGRGAPIAPSEVKRVGGRTEIRATAGDGIERTPITCCIVVGEDGHVEWREV